MPKTKWGRYQTRTVSLTLAQAAMLDRISLEDGHGNFSRAVQEAVEKEIRGRYGPRYAQELPEEDDQKEGDQP